MYLASKFFAALKYTMVIIRAHEPCFVISMLYQCTENEPSFSYSNLIECVEIHSIHPFFNIHFLKMVRLEIEGMHTCIQDSNSQYILCSNSSYIYIYIISYQKFNAPVHAHVIFQFQLFASVKVTYPQVWY